MQKQSGLQAIFNPQSVAVVGASDKADSVGNAVYRNLRTAPYPGKLIPINNSQVMVQGDKAYPSIEEAPIVPDLVIVCTPAATVPGIARTCGERGVGGMIVISAGFRETGAIGCRLEGELRAVLDQFPDMRVIGPNCLGLLTPRHGLNASFSASMPGAGNIAVVSQSGALCTAMLDWAHDRALGFSAFVSVGNMVDVGMAELIEYFEADESTAAVLLYVEAVDDPARFISACRSCSRQKPILALKAGRFAQSSQAAKSHTGALAGADVAYDAAFRRAGVTRVASFEELFDSAKLLQVQQSSPATRLAIVTNAGGPGILAADAWLSQNGDLAVLSAESIERLNGLLPPQWSHGNPVDLLGDATCDRYEGALEILMEDPAVDAIVFILTPQSMTNATQIAETIAKHSSIFRKTVLAVWMGGPLVRQGRHILELAKIPVYVTPEQAINALGYLRSATKVLSPLRVEQPGYVPMPPVETTTLFQGAPQPEVVMSWRTRLSTWRGLVSEVDSKQLLTDFGISVVPSAIATTATEAMQLAQKLGFPAVLKVVSPDISHKTEVGGVALDLTTPTGVAAAFQHILDTAKQACPDARIDGVSVQTMVHSDTGLELLLGATKDPQFGPLILIGSGGITAEIQRDVATELLPLDTSLVLNMLQRLRIAPLFNGFRGKPGVDMDELVQTILRFAQLVEALPEIETIEINPLLATPGWVTALDARIILSAAQGTDHLRTTASVPHVATRL